MTRPKALRRRGSWKLFLLSTLLVLPMQLGCSFVRIFAPISNLSECPTNPALTQGIEGSFDAGSLRDNVLWYGRNRIWTLYTAAASAAAPFQPTIGIASSGDGCTWSKSAQVITPNPAVRECAGGVFSPAAYYDAKTDILTVAVSCVAEAYEWYSGPAVIAELEVQPGNSWFSPDNYEWKNGGEPVLRATEVWEGEQGVYAPSFLKLGGKFYMFYSSSFASIRWQVGLAVASSSTGPWTKSKENPITPGSIHCEEPAPIHLKNGDTYLFCDTVGTDLRGIDSFKLIGADPLLPQNWLHTGIYHVHDEKAWSLHQIGSQSFVQLPDGRVLIGYNGAPRGAADDRRQIGFAFVGFGARR